MSTIKGIKELLSLCTDFVNEIDDFEDVELNDDFMCYPNTNEIFISLVASQNCVQEFMETLLERTDIYDISEFTWSLLHEVGHCETVHLMNKRTLNHCRNIKRKVVRNSIPSRQYYYLTDERLATNWAIRSVEDNYDFVKYYNEKIIECLKEICRKNNLDWTV